MTEREAAHRGVPHVAAAYSYRDSTYRSSIEDRERFVKALADPESGEIMGCHMIGSDASILIQEVANGM